MVADTCNPNIWEYSEFEDILRQLDLHYKLINK